MKFYFQTGCWLFAYIRKPLLVMKLTLVLLITVFIQSSFAGFAQKITYKEKNVRAEQFFQVIKSQTSYKILYAEEMVVSLPSTDLNLQNASIEYALDTYFKDKPLSYSINNNVIVIKYKKEEPFKQFTSLQFQQQVIISGKITDEKKEPLPGVSVLLKGTNVGTTSTSTGDYQLKIPVNTGSLVFSFIGFLNEEAMITPGKNVINIQLKEEPRNLTEVIVVGYGTQRKTSTTSAVSAVKGTELVKAPVANISSSLAGRVSGITARPNGNVPGQDNPDIYVRGIGTLGNNKALIVIDGIIRDNLSQIDANQIESVTVLKDAAAVAPYGLGGANGVILITTKHGKEGTINLTFGSYYGFQRPTVPPRMLNAKDYMILKNEGNVNSGLQPTFPAEVISNYDNLHASNPDLYPNSNAQRELIKLNAPQQNYNFQVSGGSDKVQYFAGLNYYTQDGITDLLNYKRYNYNVMLDIKATPTTKITISLNNTQEENKIGPNPQAISYIPTRAIYYSNGLGGESGGSSPVGELTSGGYNKQSKTTALNTISIEQQLPFVQGLSIKGAFSYDPTMVYNKQWIRPNYYYIYDGSTNPGTYTRTINGDGITSLNQSQTKNQNYTYQGYINYKRTLGNHELTGLLVAEARNSTFSSISASRRGFNVNLDELSLGSSNRLDFDNGGSSTTSSQLGFVYRLNYAYKGKYLIEATGRYDGHYYFAPSKRWAYFPAVSLGWRLSEESFIKDIKWIDNLKLRASWGKSGNLAGNPFQYSSYYNLQGNSYAFGNGRLLQGSYTDLESNPNITWEKATKSNVGVDASFWNGKLTLEADYFYEKRTEMLLQPAITVPVEYGLNLAQQNDGEMSNRGIEFVIGTNHKFTNDLQLGLTGNFSYSKNKLLQVFETDATRNNPLRSRTGRPLNVPFGFLADGIFSTDDDLNKDGIIDSKDGYNIIQFGTLHPGDVRYKDLNGDGKIDNNDETVVGYPTYPQITYGFTLSGSWKGFDLSLFFQGSTNSSLNIQGYQTVPFRINNTNTSYEYYDNRWTLENQEAKYPKAYASKNTNNTTNSIGGDGFGSSSSSIWMANTGFLRLKTGVIGYTLPGGFTKKHGVQSLRFYVSGQNIFTLSKLKFMDPETGYTNREEAYPVQKAFILGLNLNF